MKNWQKRNGLHRPIVLLSGYRQLVLNPRWNHAHIATFWSPWLLIYATFKGDDLREKVKHGVLHPSFTCTIVTFKHLKLDVPLTLVIGRCQSTTGSSAAEVAMLDCRATFLNKTIKLCRRCSKIKQFSQAILLFSVAANVASKSGNSGHRTTRREIER